MIRRTRSTRGVCVAALFVASAGLLPGCSPEEGRPEGLPPNRNPNPPAASGFVEVPNPLSGDNPLYRLAPVPPPAAGETVADPRLRTSQTRVVQTAGLRHEYARHDPFNADASRVLLTFLPEGQWRVYRTATVPYDRDENLLRTVDMEEPRWDPADPARLWGFQDFRILTLDVNTGQTAVVKDFSRDPAVAPILAAHPDLYRITTRDEGEPSLDFRCWALLLQGSGEEYRARFLLTWDRQQDRILGIRALPGEESRIDWVGMSPRGTWALIGGDWDNRPPLQGLTLANLALTEFHRLDYSIAHSDVGLDSDGREVIVMQNNQTDFIDLIPLDPGTRPILESGGSYENTGRVKLIRLLYESDSPIHLNSGVHISCNLPGFCLVSTFTEPGLPERNWLDRTITLVRLDPRKPRVFTLAKVYGTSGAYWEETHASLSRDGSRAVWATNWGQEVGKEKVWLMQLNLPAGWTHSFEARP